MFSIKKSIKNGPFRCTFSKSGVSVSVGGKGFRLTIGPKGPFVSFSKFGFSYRKKLALPANNLSDSNGPEEVQEIEENQSECEVVHDPNVRRLQD